LNALQTGQHFFHQDSVRKDNGMFLEVIFFIDKLCYIIIQTNKNINYYRLFGSY